MKSLPNISYTFLFGPWCLLASLEVDLYRVDCLPDGAGGSVSFTFGSVTIDVPYFDPLWHPPDLDDYCILGFEESSKTCRIPNR